MSVYGSRPLREERLNPTSRPASQARSRVAHARRDPVLDRPDAHAHSLAGGHNHATLIRCPLSEPPKTHRPNSGRSRRLPRAGLVFPPIQDTNRRSGSK